MRYRLDRVCQENQMTKTRKDKKLDRTRAKRRHSKNQHKTYCAKINSNADNEIRKRLIRKTVIYNEHELRALYDPGANTSHISHKTAEKLKLKLEDIEKPYRLWNGEGTIFTYNGGWVTKRTKAYELQIGTHLEQIQLDVTRTDDDIILGRDWAYDQNPEIDFRTEEFIFSRCRCTKTEKGYVEISRKQMNAIIRKKPWKVFAACQIRTP